MRLFPSLLILLLSVSLHAEDEAVAPSHAALIVQNHFITEFRAPFIGVTPLERARRAQHLIQTHFDGLKHQVELETVTQGYAVKIDGALIFWIQDLDRDPLAEFTLSQTAELAQQRLQTLLNKEQQAAGWRPLLRSWTSVGLLCLAAFSLLFVLSKIRQSLSRKIQSSASTASVRLGLLPSLWRERIRALLRLVLTIIYRLLWLLIIYEWMVLVLAQFIYTQPWGDQLNGFLMGVLRDMVGAIAAELPNLFIAAVIFYLAKLGNDGLRRVMQKIETRELIVTWLDADSVRPTRQLLSVAIWLLGVVMAYPYLPGSNTAAFQGLSVLLGLMLSLGGSSLLGQAFSGLILMYTRTLRVGEFVRIGTQEGTVVEIGTFTTRVRTGLGEELTFPNAFIASSVTVNYSRAVKGPGFILDTTVTIGYDSSWRQVAAMLIEAAQRTPGVLSDPAPQVFQTSLSDFYAHYRLVCQAIPSEPQPRAQVLSQLHAHIQDVFNFYGVQIMSPNYFEDPASPKIVPPENWYPAPAKKNE